MKPHPPTRALDHVDDVGVAHRSADLAALQVHEHLVAIQLAVLLVQDSKTAHATTSTTHPTEPQLSPGHRSLTARGRPSPAPRAPVVDRQEHRRLTGEIDHEPVKAVEQPDRRRLGKTPRRRDPALGW
jgi:hypothetical protein